MLRRRIRAPRFKNAQATEQWFKNIGKSLGYITTGTLVNLAPGISDTVRSGKDMVGEYKDPVSTFLSKNTTMKKRVDMLLGEDNTYLDIASEAFKNLKADLKSGNINNTARAEAVENKLMGLDMDFDVDMDFDDMGDDSFDDNSSKKNVVVPNINITSNITKDNPMVKTLEKQIDVSLNTAKAQASRDTALAKVQFSFMQDMNSNIINGLTAVNANLNNIIDFNHSVVARNITAQASFYETGMKFMDDMLIEIRKITSPKKDEVKKKSRKDINDIFMFGQSFDFSGYIDNIKSNLKRNSQDSVAGSMLGMLQPDMLKSWAANPIGFILSTVIPDLIPEVINKTIKRFDDMFMAFIPALTKKFATWAKTDGEGIGGKVKKLLGSILGVTVERKATVDLSSYKRDAVPFDGMARKAIVEVIPTYLSKILAAITKQGPITFDYKSGKYKTVKQVKDDFYKDSRSSILSEYDYDTITGMKDLIKAKYGSDSSLVTTFEDALVKLSTLDDIPDYRRFGAKGLKQIFNNKTDPNNKLLRDTKVSSKDLGFFKELFGNLSKTELMRLFGINQLNAAQAMPNILSRLEMDDIERAGVLFNGAFDETLGNDSGRPSGGNGGRGGGNGGGGGGNPPSREAQRLAYVKTLLRQGKAIPPEYSDVVLDEEARHLQKENEDKTKKFKFFKSDNAVTKFIESALEKPMEFINEQANKLETVLHDIIFGPGKDQDDNNQSLIERIKSRVTGFFDYIKDKLFNENDGFFSKIKNSEWYQNITNKAKTYMNKASDYFLGTKDAVSGLYSGGLLSDGFNSAKGSVMRGWGSVKDSMRETGNNFAGLFGANNIKDLPGMAFSYLGGRVKSFADTVFGGADKLKNSDISLIGKNLLTSIKDNAPDALGKGIIGAGVGLIASSTATGLLSGLVLGPIGGAVVGMAGSFLSKSETFNDLMFGKMDASTGKRMGGFISEKTQEFFKKNKKSIITGTTIGTGLGTLGLLPGFVLGGPVGGALTGFGASLIIKSDSFQKFMFGDDGFYEKAKTKIIENLPNIKKFIPSTLLGSLGGVGLMSIIGLNPLLGAVGGAAIGIVAKAKTWGKSLFGDPNSPDKGGLGIKLIDFVGDKIVDPLNIYIHSLGNSIMNWVDTDIKQPIMDTLSYGLAGFSVLFDKLKNTKVGSFFDTQIITPIVDTFKLVGNKVFEFTKSLLKNTIKVGGTVLGKIISSPVKLIQKLTVGVVEGFFTSSVMKEVRAPFQKMIDSFTSNITDMKDRIVAAARRAFGLAGKGIYTAVTNLGKGTFSLISKLFGSTGTKIKERRAARRQQNEDSVLQRIKDIRAGVSSKYDGEDRTFGEKFLDYADSFNPFSKLRRYGNIGVTDSEGNSVLRGLRDKSAERRKAAEEAKAAREADLDRLRGRLGTDKFRTRVFGKMVKGYNKMTNAEQATVRATTEINADTTDIKDNSDKMVTILGDILRRLAGIGDYKAGTTSWTYDGSNAASSGSDYASGKTSWSDGGVGPSRGTGRHIANNLGRFFGNTKSSGNTPSVDYGNASWSDNGDSSSVDLDEVGMELSGIDKIPGMKEIVKAAPDSAKSPGRAGGGPLGNIVGAGIEGGLEGALSGKGKMGAIFGVLKGFGKVILPLAAKAGLITIGVIGLFKLIKNPEPFFNAIGKVLTKYVEPALNKVGTYIKEDLPGDFLNALMKWSTNVQPIFDGWGVKLIKGFFKEFVPNIQKLTTEAGKKMISNLFKKVKDDFANTNGTLSSFAGAMAGKFVNGISGKFDELMDKLNPVKAFKQILPEIKEMVYNINPLNRFKNNNSTSNAASGIFGGLFGISKNTSETDAITELNKYSEEVSDKSLTVSDKDYWKVDTKGRELGGLGSTMFKIARLTALPGRMINKTLKSVNDDFESIETDSETKSQSIGGKIKSAISGIWDNIKNGVGNVVDKVTDNPVVNAAKSAATAATTNSDGSNNFIGNLIDGAKNIFGNIGGGEVGIGSKESDYYKFPSNTIDTSDVNYNRKLPGGSSSPHKGLDMMVRDRVNKIVKSTTNGVVVYTGTSPVYGNMVQIRDENGMYHMYGHLSTISVNKGDHVTKGSSIGIEGSTGQSTGSHVHYEVGTGYTPGDHLIGRVHPAEYIKSYSSGASTIKATPIDKYRTGSYWGSGSNSNSYGFHLGGDEETSTTTAIDAFISPFKNFASSLSGVVGDFLGLTSNSSTNFTSAGGTGSNSSSSTSVVDSSGKRLGDFTKQFESGSRGSSTISSGSGDYGGASFGTYQLASNFGSLKTFWDKYYASEYPGVTPGDNQKFKDAWTDAVNNDPTGFAANEHSFATDTYYKVFTGKTNNTGVINPDKHSRAAQEIAWSTSLQYGPGSDVWRQAISDAGLSAKATPDELVNAIQNYKVKTVGSYFGKNSTSVQNGVKNRHDVGERNALLSIGSAEPIAIGGGELGNVNRFEIKRVGGSEVSVSSGGSSQIIQLLRTIVTTLVSIDSSTKTTSTNTTKMASKTTSISTGGKSTNKKATSRNSSLDIAEQRRKEKIKSDYQIAQSIAKGY